MATAFEIVTDEYLENLEAIRSLNLSFAETRHPARTRIAAANSATLLVAATFEEYIREMGREYARQVVRSAGSFENLPKKLVGAAWRRTMDDLARMKIGADRNAGSDFFHRAHSRFTVIYDFCKGDLSKDIYKDLIKNDMNMRTAQINEIFNLCGLSDVCGKCSDKQAILELFGETEHGRSREKLVAAIDEFFDRRNEIAHALNPSQSSGIDRILKDLILFENFGKALQETLERFAPQ